MVVVVFRYHSLIVCLKHAHGQGVVIFSILHCQIGNSLVIFLVLEGLSGLSQLLQCLNGLYLFLYSYIFIFYVADITKIVFRLLDHGLSHSSVWRPLVTGYTFHI